MVEHREPRGLPLATRSFARRMVAGAMCLLASACARTAEEPRPAPDVLLVTIDTLRADHLSAYGYGRHTSPTLDRLAEDGALFEVAYAATPATTPSHATLLTSLYPLAHGVLRNGIALRADVATLPSLLATAGYRTAAFVSSYPVSREFGLARGFAHFDDHLTDPGLHPPVQKEDGEHDFARLGEHTVSAALAWRASAPRDVPSFVWVHLFDPHAPYAAPAPYDGAFRRDHATLQEQRIDAYDGEILYADAQLDRLLRGYAHDDDRRGLLTIVTSDHGEAFGERGWQGHNRSVFEEEVRIPLVVHWPGVVSPGRRIAEAVHLIDVLPTVLAATGVAASERFAGIDLLPAITRQAALEMERTLFLQRPYFESPRRARRRDMVGFGFGVRQGRWKYIQALDEGQQDLFDLAADPDERRDLGASNGERLDQLAEAVETWRTGLLANDFMAPPRAPADVRRKLRALGYAD